MKYRLGGGFRTNLYLSLRFFFEEISFLIFLFGECNHFARTSSIHLVIEVIQLLSQWMWLNENLTALTEGIAVEIELQ